MAGELTRQETESFYDLSADFDTFDPGIDAFNQVMKRAEVFVNGNGGADSISYRGTLLQLNDQWEFHDQVANFTGKLYVCDEGIVEISPDSWDGPYHDAQGTFFRVDSVEFVSLGVIDVNESNQGSTDDGETFTRKAKFAYAFNQEDADHDTPMFYAQPDEVLHVKYEHPTMDAVASRLYRDLPDDMDRLNRRIDKAGFDPIRLIKGVKKSVKDLQNELLGNQELQTYMTRYVLERLELDKAWPYGVTIQGPVWYAEDGYNILPLVFDKSSIHYMFVSGASFNEYTEEVPKRVDMSLSFAAPTSVTEDEGVDGHLVVPLSSIKDMFSTRPMKSIKESIISAQNIQAKPVLPQEADVSIPEYESPVLHPKLLEYRKLVAFEQLLSEAIKGGERVRNTRYQTADDALEVAKNFSKWLHEQASDLGLTTHDIIRVSGAGVMKANATVKTKGRNLHVEVDEDDPIISPDIGYDIMGTYEGAIAEVDTFEDEEGAKYWIPAPKLTMVLMEFTTPLVDSGFPLLAAAVKSSATVRLDNSSSFEIPKLDSSRKRNAALTALATEQKGSTVLGHIYAVERAFFNENPTNWNEAGPVLKRIRKLSRGLAENPDELVLEAFRQQLIGRRVDLIGDTWIGQELHKKKTNVGVIDDMFFTELPDGSNELVADIAPVVAPNVVPVEGYGSRVVLRTVSNMRF